MLSSLKCLFTSCVLTSVRRPQAGDVVERIDAAAATNMDAATARSKLAAGRAVLRLWRPATGAVFELDMELAAQTNHRSRHVQQEDDTGLM
jgi:hypothetical protein